MPLGVVGGSVVWWEALYNTEEGTEEGRGKCYKTQRRRQREAGESIIKHRRGHGGRQGKVL